MSGFRRMAERWRGAGFATVLLVILIAVNLLLNPSRFHPSA
ncbi:MAG: ABC transporter permease, partial [Mesorhizobium sp.]